MMNWVWPCKKPMTVATDRGTDRADVVAYLRWLADQPSGTAHRQVLFRAALLISRDATTIFVPLQQRHGDEGI